MLTLLTLVSVICIAVQISNTKNTNCENVCQTNSLCVKKCEEYAKNPNRHPLSDPNCGLSKLDGKVPEFVDETEPPGQTSNKPSFPWMVSLQYKYESNNNRDIRPHFCSGVIINENFVLSSAHCV